MPDRAMFGGEPWWVRYGKQVWSAAKESPLTVVLLFGMWFVYVEITHGRVRAAEGQKYIMDRQAEIEERREKWAERHSAIYLQSFTQISMELSKLGDKVDRNTDAIRGKVFSPKSPEKKQGPNP